MWSRFATLEDGGDVWFHGKEFETRFAGLEYLSHACYRTACSDAADKGIHLSIGVLPDFFGSGFAVRGGIGWIFKLLRDKSPWIFLPT